MNNNCERLILIGHKFGCPVAIEMALQLQREGLNVVKHLICVEGSHKYITLSETDCLYVERIDATNIEEIEQEAILAFLEMTTGLTEEVTK